MLIAILADAATNPTPTSDPATFWMSFTSCAGFLIILGDRLWPRKDKEPPVSLAESFSKLADSTRNLADAMATSERVAHIRHEEIVRAIERIQ